jgi:hypothetical protein
MTCEALPRLNGPGLRVHAASEREIENFCEFEAGTFFVNAVRLRGSNGLGWGLHG